MPTTSSSRRKAGPRTKQKQNQTKLAFHGNSGITKPASVQIDSHEKPKTDEKADILPAVEVVKREGEESDEAFEKPAAAAVPVSVPVQAPADTTKAWIAPGLSTLDLDASEQNVWKTAVQNARRITPAQIKSYFTKAEKKRLAPRIHCGDQSLEEKLLADWDLDSRYGPCASMGRTQRWQRAHIRYELNPSMEVLAVLLSENAKSKGVMEQSRIGKVLSNALD